MIRVKLLGGTKKLFSTDLIQLEEEKITIQEILDLLQKRLPENTKLDVANILVAINGVDSSAIEGFSTKLKDQDIVSIIPIIHGGSNAYRV